MCWNSGCDLLRCSKVRDTRPRRATVTVCAESSTQSLWRSRSTPDERTTSRILPIGEVSSAAFLHIGQQFLTAFCEGDELRDGAQLSPQWSWLKTTAHIKQKRNTLTCQSAVENHLSLGKIDKVKKKPVSILTLHKEYGIVIKHKINYSSSA